MSIEVPPDLVKAVAGEVAQLLLPVLAAPNVDPYLDVEAAASYLACERQRLYDLVSAGRLPAFRDGRRLLFRREQLDAHVGAVARGWGSDWNGDGKTDRLEDIEGRRG